MLISKLSARIFIVNWLRHWVNNFDIKEKEIYIPDDSEKYGFAEGKNNIGEMLQFFADMLEE